MRVLTAIVAAVLSVTTGGSLRCPCQLAQVFRPAAAVAPVALADKSPCRSCPCHSHEEPESPAPTAPQPGPRCPACPHCLSLDLTPPPAGGDRGVDDQLGDAAADLDLPRTGPVGGATAARVVRTDGAHPPPPDHLRYCHAFRC